MLFTKEQVNKTNSIIKNFQHLKGFKLFRLSDFLKSYKNLIEKNGYNFKLPYRITKSNYEILVLVDCRKKQFHSMTPLQKKKYKNYNNKKRSKIKKKTSNYKKTD